MSDSPSEGNPYRAPRDQPDPPEANERADHSRWRWVCRVALITTIGAPAVGFLGTIISLMSAFQSLGEESSVDPTQLAERISNAMLSTAVSIPVMIIALFVYVYAAHKLGATTKDQGESAL